jgi:hypothetical protein
MRRRIHMRKRIHMRRIHMRKRIHMRRRIHMRKRIHMRRRIQVLVAAVRMYPPPHISHSKLVSLPWSTAPRLHTHT